MSLSILNKINLKLGLALMATLYVSSIYGQEKGFTAITNNAEVEQKLILASKNMQSISSDFKQEKQLEYLETTIESTGKFWFKDGNKLRWEYFTPFKYIIAVNQGKFIIKDEEKVSVFDTKSNKAFQELNDILMSTVNGTLINSGKFTIELTENSTSYLVILTPKSTEMQSVLSKIQLYFSKTDLTVYKVKMIESTQDYTLITFTNKQINSEIPDSVFDLK